MASIVPGFEYDVFISYRHNDNRSGWVTEFVKALQEELATTLKDPVSVYFDTNPHDGLLETHNIDKSLENKLKCLILIPIISQTFCDPKSFAWQHEFCAFNKLVRDDHFGRDIKLSNGNVASRILPVKIHDLDQEDNILVENELGGVLRSIEFIYRSPGVNRPLKPGDERTENQNHTYYRDQINKVANAVKEIITGIKKHNQRPFEAKEVTAHANPGKPRSFKSKIILAFFLVLVLPLPGYLLISKFIKPPRLIEKSIAVLPFRNLSNDTSQLYFCDGFMEEILNNLQKIKSFSVRSRTSSDQYRNTKKSLTTIGNELNVNYLVEGSVGREGDNLKIWVQLIDSKADRHIWSDEYIRESKQIFSLQSEIAKEIAIKLKTELSPEEIEKIEKRPTENQEAYNLYLLGKYFINQYSKESLKKGISYFKDAIRIDSTFAMAYSSLAQCYQFMLRNSWISRTEGNKEAKKAVLKAIELDQSLGEPHATLGLIMIVFDLDLYGPEIEFQKALKLSPNSSEVYSSYAQYLRWVGRYDEGIIIAKRAAELDPLTPFSNFWLGTLYMWAGKYDESINYLKKMVPLDSNYIHTYAYLAYNYSFKNSYSNATYFADKTLSLVDFKNGSTAHLCRLVWIYAKAGETYKAKELFKQVNLKMEDPVYLAISYTGFGDYEKAFECLSKAYEVRSGQLIFLKIFSNTFLKEISSDPRYIDLLKKIGFKEI